MMIYVHIPFCVSKCAYCDFNSFEGATEAIPEYLDALEREMRCWCASWPSGQRVDSVYIGGGTPSILTPVEIGRILRALEGSFRMAPGAEISIEINPATWSGTSMIKAVQQGINRLSVGVQAFDDDALRSLGRAHGSSQSLKCLKAALESGAASVSADLIYGIPGLDMPGWERGLRTLVAAGIPHLSAYALTLEEGTGFAAKQALGELDLPGDETVADMYLAACDILKSEGYRHYEISNFALKGHLCRHNMGYWTRQPYLGLGAGAHSMAGVMRWRNPALISDYIENALSGPRYEVELLRPDDIRFEEVMLGLRTDRGIPEGYLGTDRISLETLRAEGWIEEAGDRLVLSDAGMLISNPLTLELTS